MRISTIRGLSRYIRDNSGFSGRTVNNAIVALGFHPLHSTQVGFGELSDILKACTDRENSEGYKRLFKYSEKKPFFKTHRKDIVSHIELKAYENDIDVVSMVRDYLVTQKAKKPSAEAIGKALWDKDCYLPELNTLYNYFAKYALCEMSWTWYRYLEENPIIAAD